MIELSESCSAEGFRAAVTGLKSARVVIRPHGAPFVRSDGVRLEPYLVRTARCHAGRILKPSTRYRKFWSYSDAVDYALGYANRVAKEKRERDA